MPCIHIRIGNLLYLEYPKQGTLNIDPPTHREAGARAPAPTYCPPCEWRAIFHVRWILDRIQSYISYAAQRHISPASCRFHVAQSKNYVPDGKCPRQAEGEVAAGDCPPGLPGRAAQMAPGTARIAIAVMIFSPPERSAGGTRKNHAIAIFGCIAYNAGRGRR